jgi:hypothetical protein
MDRGLPMKFISGTLRVDFLATAQRSEMQSSVYKINSLGLSCYDRTRCGCGDNALKLCHFHRGDIHDYMNNQE